MAPRDDAAELFGISWVHVFEQDTADGAVFRPDDADIPLSRRPRTRLELSADGTAALLVPGADDRPVREPATWREEAGAVVIRDARDSVRARIVVQSADRLIVRLSPSSHS